MSHEPLSTRVRNRLVPLAREIRRQWLRRFWGMDIGKGVSISLSARLDKTNPRGIHIGDYTAIPFEVAILTHDFVNNRHVDVSIGKHCMIGARSIIMPGVTIGDNCIISVASVVVKDIPPNSLAAGNPARVIERGIHTISLGRRIHPKPEATSVTGTCPDIVAGARPIPSASIVGAETDC